MMISWLKRKSAGPAHDKELQLLLQSSSCDKCPNHCALSAPKCVRGKLQANALEKKRAG